MQVWERLERCGSKTMRYPPSPCSMSLDDHISAKMAHRHRPRKRVATHSIGSRGYAHRTRSRSPSDTRWRSDKFVTMHCCQILLARLAPPNPQKQASSCSTCGKEQYAHSRKLWSACRLPPPSSAESASSFYCRYCCPLASWNSARDPAQRWARASQKCCASVERVLARYAANWSGGRNHNLSLAHGP